MITAHPIILATPSIPTILAGAAVIELYRATRFALNNIVKRA
jgi:hypothetical protein